MRKEIFPLIFILTSCVAITPPPAREPTKVLPQENVSSKINSTFDSYPDKGDLIIFSFSPRFANKEDEKKEALLSAASQASSWYKLHLTYGQLIDENVIRTLRYEDVDIDFDRNLALSLLNQLEIIEETRKNDHYFLKVRLNGKDVPSIVKQSEFRDSVPAWIYNPPQFDEYYSGVGLSGRKKTPAHSWQEADKRAAAEIGRTIKSSIEAVSGNIERGNVSTSSSTSISKSLSRSDVIMEGYLILSRWFDGNNYYSLAICKK